MSSSIYEESHCVYEILLTLPCLLMNMLFILTLRHSSVYLLQCRCFQRQMPHLDAFLFFISLSIVVRNEMAHCPGNQNIIKHDVFYAKNTKKMAFRMMERTKTLMYFDFINEKGTFHQYHSMILIFY